MTPRLGELQTNDVQDRARADGVNEPVGGAHPAGCASDPAAGLVRSSNPVLAVGTGLTSLGLGLLGPGLPAYAQSRGSSTTLVGLLLTGLGVARLLVSLPAAWIARHGGDRRLLVGGPAVIVPTALLCAAVGGF